MQRQAQQQQWPNNSMRQKQGVQGLNNGKSQSMQDQLAASLTYAQKVKGRRPRNAQQPQALPQAAPSTSVNRQFRMVPAQQILAAQAMPAALQHYAYPYNYSNLQRQRSAQQASQQAQPVASSNPPTRPSSASASSTQPSSSAVGHSSNPYRSRGRGPQRDFFDRRVQHNVNNAVSQYYNYPQSQSQQQSQVNQYQSQRLAQQQQQRQMYRQNRVNQYRFNQQQQQQQQQRQSMMNTNNNNNMMMRGRRDQRRNNPNNNMSYRGGRGGGSFGQRPSYRDNQRNNMNHQQPSSSSSGSGGVNRKRGKPSDLQLDRYQNAADRDVLCWIFENQGKCRYGERCQWLHLDRETGQYIPTVYIMNSLSDKEMVCKPVNDKKEQDEKEDEKASEEEATPKGKKEDEQDDDDDDDVDPVVLQKKFMLLMQEGIKKKAEEEEKRKVMEAEENKMQKEDKKKKKKGKEEQDEDNKEEEEEEADICKEVSKYGAYGTTFDRQNVCWEFNTFVGCRKGSKCKWAHQYLVKESAHPYTGEKLNGMAVRKFRVSNNI